jgi:hypothetical protein
MTYEISLGRYPSGADDHAASCQGASLAHSGASVVSSPRSHMSAWLT